MKWNNFTYLLKQGLRAIWKNKLMSFASFCIMLVSLVLLSTSVILILNMNTVLDGIEDLNEITVYMAEDISDEQITSTQKIIESTANVESVEYRSKEQILAAYKENLPDEDLWIFDRLMGNPMPETFIVRIKDLEAMDATVTALTKIDKVEEAVAPYDFATFLIELRQTLTIIFGAMLIVLVIVTLVIVSNATRTSVYARRKEINIMKYVGATNGFIKIPFFVEGMTIGIVAGVCAWALTKGIFSAISGLFSEGYSLWNVFQNIGLLNAVNFSQYNWLVLAGSCLAGALLGALGTVFSTGKHLRV